MQAGSAHQKHVTLLGTPFLYRIARDSNNPGYSVLKYWWTKGCFPTGQEVPVRVHEFEAEYLRAHVPEEVEEWLRYFIVDPLQELAPAMDSLRLALEAADSAGEVPLALQSLLKPQGGSVCRIMPHVKRLENSLGIEVPAICVRGVMQDPALRTQVLDDAFEYSEVVRASGSTPHRRTMRALLEEDYGSSSQQLLGTGRPSLYQPGAVPASLETPDEATGGLVSAALDVPKETAPDELALVRMLASFAEGGARSGNYEAAEKPLQSALMFSNCRGSRSALHSNLASAQNHQGRFLEAEENARESLMLKPSRKAYSNLTVALAYQERSDEAISSVDDALALFPEDAALSQLRASVVSHVVGRPTKSVSRDCSLYHTIKGRQQVPGQLSRGLLKGAGVLFGHEYDAVRSTAHNRSKPTTVHFQLNPTSRGLGSVMRRSGSQGAPFVRNTSATVEGY